MEVVVLEEMVETLQLAQTLVVLVALQHGLVDSGVMQVVAAQPVTVALVAMVAIPINSQAVKLF
jgi:hypothetical protein